MSCRASNYNTDVEYDEYMKKTMYHSPPFGQNERTRTKYDLDMQKEFGSHVSSKREYKQPWNSFNNVLEKSVEKFEPLSGFRTQYDLDMQNAFNQNNNNPTVDFSDVMVVDRRVLEKYVRR
jgi:hypothetical protein